ncbi:MAG: type III-B CRISPR module-associated Cmr3 family protein [Thermoplasmataceae archaeon]
MAFYRIEPLDTLFFRDGSPYNMGESNQINIKSIFPPNPRTATGAMRVAIARSLGWDGKGDWGGEIKSQIGDEENLGTLDFEGPFIAQKNELLFPLPMNIMVEQTEQINSKGTRMNNEFIKLEPERLGSFTDLGEVRFPKRIPSKATKIKGYIRGNDLKKILWGDDNLKGISIISRDEVFREEHSVAIKRNLITLNVDEGGLFSRTYIRMQEEFFLIVKCTGLREDDIKQFITLGGEGKGAFIERTKEVIGIPEIPSNVEKIKRFVIYFLTPANIGSVTVGEELKELGCKARIVSGCVGKPLMIGGWSFKRGPLELIPHIPPGSVFFMESEEGIDPRSLKNKIGEGVRFGFGQILIGKW